MKQLTLIIILLAGTVYAQAQNQLYVGPDGTGVNRDNDCQSANNPCETIAYALSIARGGETINLLPGIHTEQIIIDKDITIQGTDEKAPSILQGTALLENARSRVVTIVEDGGLDVVISNLIIRHGRAIGSEPDNRGGGLYSKGNHIRLEKVEFSSNSAYTLESDVERRHGGGGGIFIEGGTGTFIDLAVVDNEAEGNGGGIFIFESEVSFENVLFDRNKAGVPNVGDPYSNPELPLAYGSGGGLHMRKSNVTLRNAEILGNGARFAGGINSSDSQVLIEYSLIQDNFTDGSHGGGIAGSRGNVRLHNTRIIGNQANRGGGLYGGYLFTVTLVNCVISGNLSTSGGGIFNENSGLIFIHSTTISGNRADFRGGGISNRFSGRIRIRNSIIWGNRADASTIPSQQIFNGDSQGGIQDSELSLDYSLYSDYPGDIGGIAPLQISNSIRNRKPQFVDEEEGNYRLRMNSPARIAGDRDTDFSIYPGGPTTPVDLDGNPRVYDWAGGGKIDLGAFEIQGIPLFGPRYVTVEGDDTNSEGGNNCLDIANPCGSISHAMEEALVGDDIIVGPGVFTETLNFEKSTSIHGAGSGLDPLMHTILQAHEEKGASDGRVVSIIDLGNPDDGWNIVMHGLTIRNGRARGPTVNPSNRGGGIYNESSTLHLFDILFTDNMANIGAGMYNSGTVNLSNVIFSGNEANQSGGGLLRQGGGGFANKMKRYWSMSYSVITVPNGLEADWQPAKTPIPS